MGILFTIWKSVPIITYTPTNTLYTPLNTLGAGIFSPLLMCPLACSVGRFLKAILVHLRMAIKYIVTHYYSDERVKGKISLGIYNVCC